MAKAKAAKITNTNPAADKPADQPAPSGDRFEQAKPDPNGNIDERMSALVRDLKAQGAR